MYDATDESKHMSINTCATRARNSRKITECCNMEHKTPGKGYNFVDPPFLDRLNFES